MRGKIVPLTTGSGRGRRTDRGAGKTRGHALRFGLAAVLVAAALVIAACGGGDGDDANKDLAQSLPVYAGSPEIDRHSETVDIGGASLLGGSGCGRQDHLKACACCRNA